MLSERGVASYLIGRGWLGEAAIDGLAIVDLVRRHQNFKVVCEPGPSYFLKQAFLPQRAGAVAHEAAVYELLEKSSGKSGLSRYLPHFIGYDEEEGLLTLELLGDGHSLREHTLRRGRFSRALAAQLGRALAALHSLEGCGWDQSEFAAVRPWALSAHRPTLDFYRDWSDATAQLVRVVQRSRELCELLDQADGLWREESLVHQDVRWDNCIVVVEPGGAGPARLKLVDWELASKGDPAWDVASVFSEHLASWVLSVPVMGDTQLGSWPELARFPLKRIQPAIHSFWDAYRRRRRFDLAEHDGVLLRSTRFVAARLLQTAIEQTQSSSHLTGFAVLAVQLALNILRHPDRAARQLLGLKLSRALRS